MKITSVKVVVKENERMRGLATVTIDDCLIIHDIRIIEGNNGLFVAMPSRKKTTGDYKDIVHPTNPECRQMFNEAILGEYEKQLKA